MRRINYLLSVVTICATGIVFCQEKGFYGKEIFLEFGIQGQLPIFQNSVAEKGYVEKNGSLQKSYNLKDFGFKASLGKIFAEDFGVAIEYNYRIYQVNALNGGELNRQYIDTNGILQADYIRPQVAFLGIQERMIMPRMLFSTHFGRVPAGLTHEIGIGYSFISLTNKDIDVTYTAQGGGITAESIAKNLVDPTVEELKGLTYMYGIRMNYPITKNFLLNIGFRYSYSTLLNKKGYRKEELSESWVSGREIWSRINQHRQLGIINFSVGGMLCF